MIRHLKFPFSRVPIFRKWTEFRNILDFDYFIHRTSFFFVIFHVEIYWGHFKTKMEVLSAPDKKKIDSHWRTLIQNLKCSRIDPYNDQKTFYPYKNRFQRRFLPGNTFFCKSETKNFIPSNILKYD